MTMPPDWWRDFFTGLAADMWHAFPTPAMTRGEVDFVLRLAQPEPGAGVLDVPCGDGRHARELASRGFRVTGVDGSPALLAHARAAPLPPGLELHQRDMRELPWPGRFDLACCLGNSFGYLGDEGDVAFLRAVRGALRTGGTFVIEPVVLETVLPHLVKQRWAEIGGIHFLAAMTYDAVAGVLRSDYTWLRGPQVECKTAWLRVRSLRELIETFGAAGFAAVDAFAPDGSPFAHGGDRVWLRARA